MVERHGGKIYRVSPWALVWENGNYYLIAYTEGQLRHYRVDKMSEVTLQEEAREGQQAYDEFDVTDYVEQMFGMFGGKLEQVTLLCENKLVGAIIDRFGTEPILIRCEDGEHFRIHVQVQVSPQFYGWVAGFGGGVQITAPAAVRAEMAKTMQHIADQHEGSI